MSNTTKLEVLLEAFEQMKEWPENYDSYGSASPNSESMDHAKSWLTHMYAVLNANWYQPHPSADEQGDATLEFWVDEKKLTLYFSPYTVSYVKVIGPDINTEMEDGELQRPLTDGLELYNWLLESGKSLERISK